MARRRALSVEMIRKLHDGLGISADVLIRSTPSEGLPRSAASRDVAQTVKAA
jgi:hypothetical protein